MMYRTVVFLFSIFLSIAVFSLPTGYPAEIQPDSAQQIASFDVLPNNLKVIVKEDHRTPTVAIALFIRTGSATEGEYTGSGITHFIEHMIFNGTSNQSAQEIQNKIRLFGADIDAYTTFDYTAFKMQGPAANMLAMLDIFYDIISNPAFSKEEFAKEKDVIRKEIKLLQDEPRQYLSQALWQTAYLVHPYRNPIIGYEELIDKLTADDLKKYYEKFYVPDNMVLVLVGDIESGQIRKHIEERFSLLKQKGYSKQVLSHEPLQTSPRYREISYAIPNTSMMMGFHSVGIADRDLYALDVLAILLGEGKSSPLYQNLHNRLNLVHMISAYNYTPFNPGMFIIAATFEPGDKDKVIKEILGLIGNFKKSFVKSQEIERAKQRVITSYTFNRQTQEAEADDLGINQLMVGDMWYSTRYVDGISSVRPQDIVDVARRYLTAENMTTVLLIPSDSKDMVTKQKIAPVPPRRTVKKSLKNGIRVIISEDKALPLVSVRISIKGGLRFEDKTNNGVSNLTALMLTKGTASRSEEVIFSVVESYGGSLSAYSANNSFGISLDIMSKDIAKGLGLLGDIISHPSFPEDKLKVLKNDIKAQIKLMDNDIFASTEKRLRQNLFRDHPYGMISIGMQESIEKISRRDIHTFYKSHCVGPNIVVSVCGDIDAEEAYKLIASAFNDIRRKDLLQLTTVELVPINSQIEVRENMDKRQAVVMIGFRTIGLDKPDRYPLQIISSIFSGGGGRLFANIRQKMGMAYTLGTFGMIGIDTGSFVFYAAVSPKDIDFVKNEIIAEIINVRKGDITQEEIDSAKKLLVSEYQFGLQRTGDFAQQIGLDELYGLGFDNYLTYPEKINVITREEIIQVANRYFVPEACVISITTPSSE